MTRVREEDRPSDDGARMTLSAGPVRTLKSLHATSTVLFEFRHPLGVSGKFLCPRGERNKRRVEESPQTSYGRFGSVPVSPRFQQPSVRASLLTSVCSRLAVHASVEPAGDASCSRTTEKNETISARQ